MWSRTNTRAETGKPPHAAEGGECDERTQPVFRHTKMLQFEANPEKPDAVYAHKLQELIGGAYGEAGTAGSRASTRT
jgi:hypothetical protein